MKRSVIIIGGGLAGLALSIDLGKRGYDVTVIEKGNYPRHKVCGEYISIESQNYLFSICPVLMEIKLPLITHFKLTSTGNKEFHSRLDLGGFGISRYLLENLLFEEARMKGVHFHLNSKAIGIQENPIDNTYTVLLKNEKINAALVCNASGRKSNFEVADTTRKVSETNLIAVKYHVRLERDPSLIEIHSFPGGYCGISSIEENKACLCYIVKASKLKDVQNSIPILEKEILFKNKRLKKIFNSSTFVYTEPLTISGINFNIKHPFSENTFCIGDSAGSIAPITGNGMSMGLRSAFVLASAIDTYFSDTISMVELKSEYTSFWNKEFATRVRLSRHFQKLSESPRLTNITIGIFNVFPFLAQGIMKRTHGQPF